MLESKTVAINGMQFRIQQLGAFKARAVARLLLNEVGRGLKAVGTSGVDMEEAAQKALAAGLGEMLSDLSEQTVESLTSTFVDVTMVDTGGGTAFRPIDSTLQDAIFGGGKGLSTWMQWLVTCLEFSTSDFFTEGARLKDRFARKAAGGEAGEGAKSAESPIASTGSSTASRPAIPIGRR